MLGDGLIKTLLHLNAIFDQIEIIRGLNQERMIICASLK